MIADSNIWISYLRSPDGDMGSVLQLLLDTDRVLMTGVVLAEVLQGGRTEGEYATLLPRLAALPYAEMNADAWAAAGRIGLRLRMQADSSP